MVGRSILVLLSIFSLSVAVSSAASTWYISPFGSNSNSGTSPASAFLDLSTALNASSAGDTISCAAGAYTGTSNVGLVINDITIVGSATSPSTFTGSSGYIFYMQGDSTLSTLTLDGGAAGVSVEGDNGSQMNLKKIQFIMDGNGIFLNQTNSLTIDNCYFNGDANYGLYGTFSSVSTDYIDTLIISDSDFQCASDAIYLSSTSTTTTSVKKLMVSDSKFSTESNGVYLHFAKGPDTLSFTNCSFFDMHSTGVGGALDIKGKTLVVDSCLFDGNSAEDNGAAIFFSSDSDGSELTVTNSAFYNSDLFSDTAEGGHIFTNTAKTVTISNCFFSGANYADDGGAVYIGGAASVDVNFSVFYNNFAWDYGGGLYIQETDASSVSTSAFIDNYAYYRGGGAYLLNSTGTLSNSFVYSNLADYGGGLYTTGDLTISVNSLVFAENEGTYGGGVYAASPFRSFYSLYDSNSAVTDYYADGGALYLTDNASMLFNILRNNTAEDDGGGIMLASTATLSARLLLADSNSAGSGGGISCIGGTMNLFIANFTDNTASYGSAYYCESSCSATGNYIYVDSSNSVYGCSSNVVSDEMWQGTEEQVVDLHDPSALERVEDHVSISEEMLEIMLNNKDEFYRTAKALPPQDVVNYIFSA